jgi:hypothetical protein
MDNGTLCWSKEAPNELKLAIKEYIHSRKEDD